MDSNRCFSATFFFVLMVLANSAFISDDVLESGRSRYGRSLFQIKKNCPVDLEEANYKILTSQCKAPYPPSNCCLAFNQFACPYNAVIEDSTNNCAETMYSYILLQGYPPGLFSSICNFSCPTPLPAPDSDTNGGQVIKEALLLPLLLTIIAFSLLG